MQFRKMLAELALTHTNIQRVHSNRTACTVEQRQISIFCMNKKVSFLNIICLPGKVHKGNEWVRFAEQSRKHANGARSAGGGDEVETRWRADWEEVKKRWSGACSSAHISTNSVTLETRDIPLSQYNAYTETYRLTRTAWQSRKWF